MSLKQTKEANGRKYKLVLIFAIIILITWALAALSAALTALYPELLGGLLGLFVIYCGGNVGSKWAAGKPTGEEKNGSNGE